MTAEFRAWFKGESVRSTTPLIVHNYETKVQLVPGYYLYPSWPEDPLKVRLKARFNAWLYRRFDWPTEVEYEMSSYQFYTQVIERRKVHGEVYDTLEFQIDTRHRIDRNVGNRKVLIRHL